MTLFHLVRHGTTSLVGGRVLAGRVPGHSLDARGRAEAGALARALGDRPIRRIVAGPLERASETAAPLGDTLALPVLIDGALDELDYGDWTGADWSTLADDPAWIAWNSYRGTAAIPGGETIGAVADRAMALVWRLGDDLGGGGEAALFTHADVIRALLAVSLGLAPDLSLRIAIDPASRSILRWDRGASPAVLGINLPP